MAFRCAPEPCRDLLLNLVSRPAIHLWLPGHALVGSINLRRRVGRMGLRVLDLGAKRRDLMSLSHRSAADAKSRKRCFNLN